MYWVNGCASTGEARISSTESGRRRQACGVSDPFAYALAATWPSVSTGNRMVVHVALQLRPEELRRHHEPDPAVPVGQRPVGRVVLEGAPRMLVEPDDERHLGRSRLERADGGHERRAAGGAPVLDVDEREPGRPEIGHHRVGVARVLAAAVGDLDVAPGDARVAERCADRVNAHREPAHPFVTAERVDAGTDDRDLGHCCRLRRCERVRPDPAVLDRDDLHRLADPQAGRIALGQQPLDAQRSGKLYVPDGVGDELARACEVGRLRLEPLRRPGPELAAPRQQDPLHRIPRTPGRPGGAERRRRRQLVHLAPTSLGSPVVSSSGPGSISAMLSGPPATAPAGPSRDPRCRPSRRRREGRTCEP